MSWVNQGSPSFIELHNSLLSKAVCGRHQGIFFSFFLRIVFFIFPTGKFFLKLLMFSFLSFDSKRFTVVRAMGLQINRCKNCWFLRENFFLQHTPDHPCHPATPNGSEDSRLLWLCSGCHIEVWRPRRWCGAFTLSCPPPPGGLVPSLSTTQVCSTPAAVISPPAPMWRESLSLLYPQTRTLTHLINSKLCLVLWPSFVSRVMVAN